MPPRSKSNQAAEERAKETLLNLFRNNTISLSCKPSHVRNNCDQFKANWTTDSFRSLFNRTKKTYLREIEEFGEDNGNSLDPMTTEDVGRKRSRDGGSIYKVEIPGAGSELLLGPLQLNQLHVIATWTCPDELISKVAMTVVLPSGVGAEDFAAHVADGGEYVEIEVYWPRFAVELKLMLGPWINGSISGTEASSHIKANAFNEAFKRMKEISTDRLRSTAQFAMPFPVFCNDERAEEHCLGYQDLSIPRNELPNNFFVLYMGPNVCYGEVHGG